MGENGESIYKAVLEPMAVHILLVQVTTATDETRLDRHCLDQAFKEIGTILGVRSKLGGEVECTKWGEVQKGGMEKYEFSHAAIVGFKIALTQALTGTASKHKVNVKGRHEMLTVAACFSKKVVAAVKRGSKLDQDEFDDEKSGLEDLADEPEEKKTEVKNEA